MHHTFVDMSYSFNLRIKNVEYILVDPCPGKVAQGHCSVLLHHFLSNDDFKNKHWQTNLACWCVFACCTAALMMMGPPGSIALNSPDKNSTKTEDKP